MADTAKIAKHDEIVNGIIAELEAGTAPWVTPWATDPSAQPGLPYNVATQREYSGINILQLWALSIMRGFGPGGFLTYRQAKELDGHVQKGQRGNRIIYVGTVVKEKDNGEEAAFRFLKTYNVFHVSQCEGLPERMYPQPLPPRPEPERIARAEQFINAIGADVRHGGNMPYYHPGQDYIQLPAAGQFHTVEDYYCTSLHEHGHWTGADHRLSRELHKGRYGDAQYAFEELIAELTAAFLCAHLGIRGKLQHSEYLAIWVRLLKDHKRAIFSAASKASQAVDYLRNLAEPQVQPLAAE